jgi:hypothetical protein
MADIFEFPNKEEEEMDEECQFCADVEFIINFIKDNKNDFDTCFNLVAEAFNDYYCTGAVDVLAQVHDGCAEAIEEILSLNEDGEYEN